MELHRAGVVPIVLGGDHPVTLPELRAAAGEHGPVALGQCDAHADAQDAYFGRRYTHETVFRRVVAEGSLRPERSSRVGMRGPLYDAGDLKASRELGLEPVTTDGVRELGVGAIIERVDDAQVYVSFDVDFVDPVFAPGTGTPEVGGFTSQGTGITGPRGKPQDTLDGVGALQRLKESGVGRKAPAGHRGVLGREYISMRGFRIKMGKG